MNLKSERTKSRPNFSERELDAISLELARRERDEKIRYFVPNGGQKRFIDELLRPGAFIVVNGSANGGGKTYVLVALLAAICWPSMAPACFADSPLIQKWPYPKRLRICSTPAELAEIGSIQTTIKELFPRGRYESLKKGRSYPSQIVADSGFIIDLFSYEQDAGEMAGPTLGLLAWNEPPPEDLWREGMARMRKGGVVPVCMTSLGTNPWVVDGILGKANGDDIRVLYSGVEENCRQHGQNGHLEHEQIEKILAQYDPDEREARSSGKPLSLSGRIFKSFDRAAHVAAEEFEPPQGATIGMACDPAIAKPLAMLWRYVDAAGVLHYYDEYPETPFEGAKDSNLTVSDYAAIIKSKEAGRTVNDRILDRHFGAARRSLGGKTLKEEFSEAGIDFRDSYALGEEIETGILRIKELLRWDKSKPQDSLNRPRIRISPKCKNLIASLERWGRDPKTGKPLEAYKDFIDVLRYDVMSNPSVEVAQNWPTAPTAFYGVGNV